MHFNCFMLKREPYLQGLAVSDWGDQVFKLLLMFPSAKHIDVTDKTLFFPGINLGLFGNRTTCTVPHETRHTNLILNVLIKIWFPALCVSCFICTKLYQTVTSVITHFYSRCTQCEAQNFLSCTLHVLKCDKKSFEIKMMTWIFNSR